MVRKSVRMMMVVCALALALAMPMRASAYTIYDGNMSTTYVSLFGDVVKKIGITDDYVMFRADQYEYVLLVGDIEYSDGAFTAERCKEYKITVATGYDTRYHYTVTDVRSVSLIPDDALLYSNLGDYPELVDTDQYFSFAQILLIFICLCVYLFRSIFGWIYQRGMTG